MRRRQFTSSRSRFWRDRFVQIAREMDPAGAGNAAACAIPGLRVRAIGVKARVRAGSPGLAAA